MQFCVVDIDSTLYSFEDLVARISLEILGKQINPEPVNWGGYEKEMGGRENMLKVFAKAHAPEQIIANEPYAGAVKALENLHAAGLQIRYVSDREGKGRCATQEWLAKCGFPQAEAMSCTHDKRQWLHNHRSEILTIIDDRVRTLIHARFQMRLPHVYSIRHGWNANLLDVPGIHLANTWQELETMVQDYTLEPLAA